MYSKLNLTRAYRHDNLYNSYRKKVFAVDRVCVAGKLLLIAMAIIVISGCATQIYYHGVEATDLGSIEYGLRRAEVEKTLGNPEREFVCGSGTIVTYVYNRGYIGCVEEGICDPDKETVAHASEVVGDVFYFGMLSYAISECINPCQEGHLEVFYDDNNRLIGVRELPTDRDNFCWDKRTDACHRYYNHPRPSTIPVELILIINPEDIPERICDQFE